MIPGASQHQAQDPVRIDLAIIGAAKSGTTSLHRYLGQHPRIFMPEAKELAFFLADPGDPTELALMKRYYAAARPDQLIGISEVHMLMRTCVAERIRRHNPEARVIAILRNPIDRAYSGYWAAHLHGWDSSPSFEHAIQRELDRGLRSDSDRLTLSYLEHGRYADQLEHYLRIMDRDQVAVILTEDLRDDARGTLRRLLLWLDLAREDDDDQTAGISEVRTDIRHNVTSRSRLHPFQDLLRPLARPLRAAARALVPISQRRQIRRQLILPLRRWTHVPFTPPPMARSTRSFLQDHYRSQIRGPGEILGRDLDHWLK